MGRKKSEPSLSVEEINRLIQESEKNVPPPPKVVVKEPIPKQGWTNSQMEDWINEQRKKAFEAGMEQDKAAKPQPTDFKPKWPVEATAEENAEFDRLEAAAMESGLAKAAQDMAREMAEEQVGPVEEDKAEGHGLVWFGDPPVKAVADAIRTGELTVGLPQSREEQSFVLLPELTDEELTDEERSLIVLPPGLSPDCEKVEGAFHSSSARFEYKVARLRCSQTKEEREAGCSPLEASLKELGAEGWELVQVLPPAGNMEAVKGGEATYVVRADCVLKRVKG